jgi:hypothetical protein
MKLFFKYCLSIGVGAFLGLIAPAASQAGAVIFNNSDPTKSTVALGVNDQGHLNFFDPVFDPLNTSATGLAYRFLDGFRDATAPGCLCEGWGLAVTDTAIGGRVSGWASIANGGIVGLTGVIFGSTTTSATSSVQLSNSPVTIQHFYGISLAPNVFQGNVVITNQGTLAIQDVVYRRAMDWDVPPTEFSEFVTHSGVESNLEPLGNVRFASNNGFARVDPTVPPGGSSPTTNIDFVKSGPDDHGSVFDFAFGNLEPGESRTFNIFYGAAGNLPEALDAVATISPDIYSIGQSTDFDSGVPAAADDAPTFLFAFKGVGGRETGVTQDNPVLPFVPAPAQFEFPNPTPRRWFDPPFVSKFDFSLDSGTFTSFILPSGFSGLDLIVGSTTFSDLMSDGIKEYSFLGDFGLTAVTDFSIADINPLVDVADVTAFPIFLDFTPGAGPLTMKADLSTTPVPAPLPLLGLGAFFGYSRKLRKRLKTSKTPEVISAIT